MSAPAGIDRASQARDLFRAEHSGTLSSHSAKLPGYPYGSALPHVTDHHGRPVVLISHLAEHTRNVEADARVSFLVCASGPDLQASARAALMGDAQPLDEDSTLQARYLRFFPEHAQYLEIGGFRFWIIAPVQVRLIEGFGSLHWIAGQTFAADPGEMPAIETEVLEHMNQDHRPALSAYCRHFHNLHPEQVE